MKCPGLVARRSPGNVARDWYPNQPTLNPHRPSGALPDAQHQASSQLVRLRCSIRPANAMPIMTAA